jgi:hypothetical protein
MVLCIARQGNHINGKNECSDGQYTKPCRMRYRQLLTLSVYETSLPIRFVIERKYLIAPGDGGFFSDLLYLCKWIIIFLANFLTLNKLKELRMRIEFGKWFLDIAKYVTTGVILSALFNSIEGQMRLIMFALLIVVLSLATGAFLLKRGEEKGKKTSKRK